MNRRKAREQVFFILFEKEFGADADYKELLLEFYKEKGADKDEYMDAVVGYLGDSMGEIDGIIKKNLVNWDFGRISRVNLSLLRLAACEIVYMGLPVNIAANEAVELAKKYGDEKSPSFVNGVIANIKAV